MQQLDEWPIPSKFERQRGRPNPKLVQRNHERWGAKELRLLNGFTYGDGCWEWQRSRTADGYGKLMWDEQRRGTHVLMYEMFVGDVPEGMELDHLCRNPACGRWDHLEPVTHKENSHRGNGNQYGKFGRKNV